jgi:hypothetical protein
VAEALSALDVAALLRAVAAQLTAELSALPEVVVRHHPAAGEWCAKEVLGHLIEAERRGFAGRIRTILAEDRPTFVGWEPADVARERRDCEQDVRELLVEFGALRDESANLVAALHVADLSRGGDHPKVGFLTVGDLLAEWVHHDRNHLRQIHANVQSVVWPHMGNAQKFSQP